MFQLAHVVENTEFENIALDETKHIETAWAEHQLKTTSNFAMDSKVISWFVGGLNYQVEHHLFPKVSHIHYPQISKIVQAKCKEFNMPYNYYNTLGKICSPHNNCSIWKTYWVRLDRKATYFSWFSTHSFYILSPTESHVAPARPPWEDHGVRLRRPQLINPKAERHPGRGAPQKDHE